MSLEGQVIVGEAAKTGPYAKIRKIFNDLIDVICVNNPHLSRRKAKRVAFNELREYALAEKKARNAKS